MSGSEPESNLLDDHDIEELDELLNMLENDDALRLDGAHGLLTALSVGPSPVECEAWLPIVLGEQPVIGDSQAAARLLELLLKLKQAVEYGLDHYAYDPIFAEHMSEFGVPEVDVGGWCEGFSLGIDLQAATWEAQMQSDESLIALLSPIVALGVDDGVFGEVRDPEIPALSDAEREELLQRLPTLLAEVREYWDELEEPAALQPARHLH